MGHFPTRRVAQGTKEATMAKVWEAGRDDHDANSIVQSLPSTAKGHRAILCRMDAGAIRASLFCAGTRHPPEAWARYIGLSAATLILNIRKRACQTGMRM